MFSRFTRIVCLIAAVHLLGGHWVALQSVAWVGMVVSYAAEESIAGALEKTFDGAHPCGLCKVVQEGQEEEQGAVKAVVKLDAVIALAMRLPERRVVVREFFGALGTGPVRTLAPPTRPPLA